MARHKGRVAEWNDDRGFGFVYPLLGGDRVFIHVKSFAGKQRRPVNGDIVTYELRDVKGRLQGANITFAGRPAEPRASVGAGAASLIFAVAFLLAMTGVVFGRGLSPRIIIFYVLLSLVTIGVYSWDKTAAKDDRWRTAESTLLGLGLLGGWPGALLAQRMLRHKTQKPSFQRAFWFTVIFHCVVAAWILLKVFPGS